MCKQYIDIAQCAPLNPSKGPLTFVCGQLHQYAAHRDTCDAAKGGCVCFFGTCGKIENIVRTQPVDLMSLPKMRCLQCTTREEQVGERRHGRDFLETRLLTREPVTDEGMVAHAKMLQKCWDGANICPYHDLEPSDASKPASVNGARDDANGEMAAANGETLAHDERNLSKPVSIKSSDENSQSPCVDEGIEAENPSPTHIKQEAPSTSGSPTKLEHIPAFTRESFESPDKINDDTSKVKPALGIETSRWAPGGASRLDTPPEPEKGITQEETPARPAPRRELFNTPIAQQGNTAYSGMAQEMKAFLGL